MVEAAHILGSAAFCINVSRFAAEVCGWALMRTDGDMWQSGVRTGVSIELLALSGSAASQRRYMAE